MSENKKRFNSNKCEHIQKLLIEDQTSGSGLDWPAEVNEHIVSCSHCKEFTRHISIIRESVSESSEIGLRPHAYILRQLRAYANINSKRRPPLTQRIQEFLNYPIPAYQVLTGVLLILALTIGIEFVSNSGNAGKNSAESFYLADSTHKNYISKGKTVYEDSLWARYMVTF